MKVMQQDRQQLIKVLRSWFFVRKTTNDPALPERSRLRQGESPRRANEEPAAPRAAFTIIELLIVISIIAILIGFALPSFLGTKDTARRRQAVVTAKHLELAFSEYCNQNQFWPNGGVGGDVKGDILKALTGYNGVVYFEIGTNTADTFKDPWGGYYKVSFDANFDNKVTPAEGAPPGITVSKSVIVWSVATSASGLVVTNKSWE
ncbi:MAG: prepilin-type N-terminal cleavage/methylation domain-containing protein [Verrucomicrobia bacterium]|nr:prepilin-type N-terminal cleavage/methylation domain-containing protein [Verrucomicrobiota bacterium]MBU4291961.1 prepilin-type N-terminal cleavage/methylation domain-containing protein [Verrucomicrobiota bacterium]MBU4429845.1 prepilin-type N-terminal cleavage/methylation domain-containing protein [Verrucomicrobiota bacterium]MBU4498311.1 prepilin-type N-terminal cleavage/methylation domain-containing protein [Verrucomicrobiota bacterium]